MQYTRKNIVRSVLGLFLATVFVLTSFVGSVFAASDDVQFTSTDSAVITLTDDNLTLNIHATTELESLEVGTGSFTMVMPQNSTIIFEADQSNELLIANSTVTKTQECKSVDSNVKYTITNNDSTSQTVTVTPSGTSICGSGGGGGGSSSSSSSTQTASVSTTDTTTTTTTEETSVDTVEDTDTEEETTAPAPVVVPKISAVFSRTLQKRMSNSDVLRLQKLLNSDPDTRIASSGVGSPGNETNYFGTLTERAVQKFQAKYGIISSGTPTTTGYGLAGPLTRSKLQEVFTGLIPDVDAEVQVSTPSSEVSVSALFTSGLSRGMSNSDVLRLQKLLNSDPDTRIASSGVGSPGNETNYFGTLTERAVQKFQAKYGVASDGDPGYGYVGPKTRAKLQEAFEGQSSSSSSASSSSVSSDSLGADQSEINSLEAQLEAAQKQLEILMQQLNGSL